MRSLVIFTDESCFEFSEKALPLEIPLESDKLKALDQEKPVIAQLSLTPSVPYEFSKGITVLLSSASSSYYSTTNVHPIRIGNMDGDHIKLSESTASLVIANDMLSVTDSETVYLNGKKVESGEYTFEVGDFVWVAGNRIIAHGGYLEIQGINYSSNLNVATQNPTSYEEFPIFKRPPREIHREPTETINLTAPSDKEEAKKGELIKMIIPPLMSAAMMVGIGILMGRGMMMIMSVGMTAVMLARAVFTFFSKRKERVENEKKRVKNYESYLLSKRKELQKLQDDQIESLTYHNLSPKEISHEIMSNSSRVYERAASDSDFLTLSLGLSNIVISYSVKTPEDEMKKKSDPLNDEMEAIASKHKVIESMPTVIDLKNAHLGLVGEKPYIHRQLKSIMTQLCFYQSYHDIEIIVLVEEEHRASFEWIRWYPHCRIKAINITSLISAENHRDQVLGNISQIMKQRQQKSEESKKDSRYLPHYVFIADNPKLIVNHSIMEFLQAPDTGLGFSLIYTTHLQANLPDNIRTVLRLDGGYNGTLIMNEGNLVYKSVVIPSVEGIDLESMARKLAPLRHVQGVSTQIPETVGFFELYGVERPEQIPVLQLWSQNACHKSLAVPLGLRGKDDVVALNLHENAHGPHGLVAGTTGSGKSEIVQSYILSLAVNFHPHEVGFLLIDYKGGGMANLFEDLPHLLGTITNLDGSESMRALASIKSELKRRQAIFGDAGVNNINQYTKLFKAGEVTLPMPHLFIISDEFAELKKEQPEFMAELVSTARIGRSLGVHLILATQKPSGVVDDQIWSNSKFKLALKVANESDSNEVLKTPDAARITQPGRAYLQVGNNEIYELFQSAWSGAPYIEDVVERGFDSRVYEINQLGQGVLLNEDLSEVDKSKEAKYTELDITVKHVQTIHATLGSEIVERPWLPPLGDKLVTAAIETSHDVGAIETQNLRVPLGMVDIPEEQKQVEFDHDFFETGNFAVFGSSGFGKSTTLQTMVLTLASNNSPKLCKFFILDYGNSALAQMQGLPHTADYLSIDDDEKLDKLLKLFGDELKERKRLFAKKAALNFRMYNEVAEEKLPAIFIIVDNFDVVKEVRDDLTEFFVKTTRDGTGLGVYTIASATGVNAMRYSLITNFKNKIAQFMVEKTDISQLVGRSEYALPEVRGRALVKLEDVHVAQCYLPIEHENDVQYANGISELIAEISKNNTASKAMGVRILGETVSYEELIEYFDTSKRTAWIGFDTETTEPLGLDLSIAYQVIAGGAATGKTNILRILLRQFMGNRIFVSDSQAGDLSAFRENENIVYMGTASEADGFMQALSTEVARLEEKRMASGQTSREFSASEPPILVLIDDGDAFISYTSAIVAVLEPLMRKAGELGICFIVTTMGNKFKGYDTITALFKTPQAGIVVGNPEEASTQFPSVRVARGYKPSHEIGFWYRRGDVKKVKLPFVG
ncbi:MAG: type VII secretion protein EssC [Oscillospiraceae bacterium]|nr:type VII secretion protein EssC [Oscillospiraceae bacterium]